MGKKKAITQMNATQREWGNAVGRKEGKRGRQREAEGGEGDIQSIAIRRREVREGRMEGRKEGKGCYQLSSTAIQKKNRALLQKVLVGWNKDMRTYAHLMIKK